MIEPVVVLLAIAVGVVPLGVLSMHAARAYRKIERDVERLRGELYDLRALAVDTHREIERTPFDTLSPSERIALVKNLAGQLDDMRKERDFYASMVPRAPASTNVIPLKPVVVESLGPPHEPPKPRAPYR